MTAARKHAAGGGVRTTDALRLATEREHTNRITRWYSRLQAWWHRAWHWPAAPPGRVPEARTEVLYRRPMPDCGSDDDRTRFDLRVGPYIDAGMRARGTHRNTR